MSDLSATSRLGAAAEPIWTDLAGHPFVVELARGDLPLDRFRFYVEQNLFYLPQYARVLALGAARSADEWSLALFTAGVNQIIDSELPENRALLSHAVSLGAEDRGGAAAPCAANRAYTGWLLSVALTGNATEMLAAVLPCTWSYGIIGTRLAAGAAPHPIYHEWLSFFASEQYGQVVERMRGDFEEAQSRWPSERAAAIFTTGVELERQFWDMAYTLGGAAGATARERADRPVAGASGMISRESGSAGGAK